MLQIHSTVHQHITNELSIHPLLKLPVQTKTPATHRDIFRDTLIAKKVWRRRRSNPRTTGWETKKVQAPARVRTQDLQPD